jgi:hypothetical protein
VEVALVIRRDRKMNLESDIKPEVVNKKKQEQRSKQGRGE